MSLNRREFVAAMTALGAAVGAPATLAATSPPWSIGFAGVSSDLPPRPMEVTGRIPTACQGALFRNGPALYERAGQRYGHWFDPDGMLQVFRLGARTIDHEGRFIRTDKFLREEAAGRFLYDGAGSVIDGAGPVRSNESINTANINVQPFNGELLALWEAGSPYRVDATTLDSKGQLLWNDELAGVPFSAHPRFDERGDLWNIGSVPFARRPLLVLYHAGADGTLRKWRTQELDFSGYMHDFVLTPRYLVALNSSLVVGEGPTFVGSMRWEAQRPSELLVFDRNDFSLLARIEVPPAFVFHFGNGWEEGDNLMFTACQYADGAIVQQGMRRLARQESGPYHASPALLRYRLSLRRREASIDPLGTTMEFPGFDRHDPFSAQALYGVGGQDDPESGLSSAVQRVDPRSGERQHFDYGPGFIVEEPLYVPDRDGGYLLHTWLDYRDRHSGLSILRARDLAAGPVVTARMERVLPLGFHGCHLPAA
jgi:all-trans-8'-apo-beta-carotenal 15,15'-oxygenase